MSSTANDLKKKMVGHKRIVPAKEAWVDKNPKILASLQKGIKEIEEGNGEIVKDLDSFLRKL